MTGVDTDLATLRETLNAFGVVSHNLQANRDATRIQASLAALSRVEAELSRLAKALENGDRLLSSAGRALELNEAELSRLRELCVAIDTGTFDTQRERAEAAETEASRLREQRDYDVWNERILRRAAEARCAQLQQALDDLDELAQYWLLADTYDGRDMEPRRVAHARAQMVLDRIALAGPDTPEEEA